MSDSKKQPYEFSGKYGYIHPDSKHFNDMELFEDKNNPKSCLYHKVTKIKIWTGKKDQKEVIVGIQFTYKSLIDGEEKAPEHKGTTPEEKVDEFVLGEGEYIKGFHIRIDTEVTQIGFTTSKGNTFLKGGETGEDKIIRLNEQDKYILGIFGCTGAELQSCGVLYVGKQEYIKTLFIGYFDLRYCIKKKEEYKKKMEEKEPSLELSDRALLRTCKLPDAQFNAVIKYCLF